MEYTKPVIVAQNNEDGMFAASCGNINSHCKGGTMNGGSYCQTCSVAK